MRRIAAIIATLVIVSIPLGAQFRETVTVSLIEVPVTVADESGEPVRDLTANDFVLYDDGIEQEIEYFEAIDVATAVAQERRDPNVRSIPRLHVLLLFDLSNSNPANLTRARAAAVDFVRQGLDDGALAAVATFSYEGGVKILTSFTRNERLLELAIESLGSPRYFRVADPLLLSASAPGSGTGSGGAQGVSAAGDEAVAIAQEFDRINNQLNNEYNRMRLEVQLDTLGNLARLMSGVSGRKQVILLSEGFEPKLIQGRQLSSGESVGQMETIARGEIWRIDSDERWGYSSAKEILKKMGELFRKSDVVLHAVDISGVRSYVDARDGFAPKSNEALHLLTEPTGGQVFKNTNHLADNLERVMSQQRHIYLLAFRPTRSTGEFHDLQVRVRGRSGLRITHREGYFEPSEEQESRLTMADILINDIPLNEVDLDTLAVPFFIEGSEAIVPVIVEIDGKDLLAVSAGEKFNAELFVYAFEQDEVVDYRHQILEIDPAVAADKLADGGIKYYGVLRLPPGNFAIKSLLQISGTTAGGFERFDVDLREDRAYLSPPVLLDQTDRWIMVRSSDRTEIESRYPFVFSEDSFIPAARAVVDRTTEEPVIIYSRGIEWPKARIRGGVRGLDGRSREVDVTLAAFDPGKGPIGMDMVTLQLDLGGMAPDDYIVDLEVTPHDGKTMTRSRVFTIAEAKGTADAAPEGDDNE